YLTLAGERRRVGRLWQGDEALGPRGLAHRARAAPPAVAGALEEPVELELGLGLGGHLRRAPEALGDEVVARLDRALAVGAPRGAHVDCGPVVLCHLGEARRDATAPRVADAGHAVEAPAPGGAAEAAEHRVERLHQVRLILRLGEDGPALSGVAQ